MSRPRPARLPVVNPASTWDVHARLSEPANAAAVALDQWDGRDDTRPQPCVRVAADAAMKAIDAMLAELHQMRSRLAGEIRASDDAAAVRADAMLAGGAS